MPASSAPDQVRIPLLARLKVGTKLMLLVLLPVGVLLGFTIMTAVADWHAAGQQQDFRTATQSVAVAVWHSGRPARLDHFAGPPGSSRAIRARERGSRPIFPQATADAWYRGTHPLVRDQWS